jgi:SAM-dependent methyltransferase
MLGCTAVATATSPPQAAAAAALTRAAHLQDQVHHVPADPRRLPFHTAAFTHVWAVETLSGLDDPPAVLAQAYRVLRPGGHLAVQELVPGDGASPVVAGTSFAAAGRWARVLAAAGFVDVVVRDVSDAAQESAALPVSARERLARTLAAVRDDPALAAVAARRAALSAAVASRALRLAQILGRRP